MKKIKKAVCILLLTFVFCFGAITKPVFADMGIPEASYDSAVITNKDGAWFKAGDASQVIPYGEVVEVWGEYQGEIYIEYDGRSGSIDMDDAKPVIDGVIDLDEDEEEPEEVAPKNTDKIISGPIYLMTFTDESYLYKGPSKRFDKVSENPIPINTIVECTHTTLPDGVWVYVTYNNKEGWMYQPSRDGYCELVDYIPGKATVLSDTKIYDNPPATNSEGEDNYEEIGEISEETQADVLYGFTTYRDQYYYIKTSDVEGWVTEYDIIRNNLSSKPAYAICYQDVKIYSDIKCEEEIDEADLTGEIFIKGIATYLKEYRTSSWPVTTYQIEYDEGKTGYIQYYYLPVAAPVEKKSITLSGSRNKLSKPMNADDFIIGESSDEEKIVPSYIYYDERDYYAGVKEDDDYFWVKLSSGEYSENYEGVKTSLVDTCFVENVKSSKKDKKKRSKSSSDKGGLDIDLGTIALVGGSLAVAVVAGATIFLTIKKRTR